MNVFTQKFNRLTGKLEWTTENEEYDYHQEVARSSYADMLHDEERNHKYFVALEKAINKVKKQGKPTNVLDIGTGTGLLAMMAGRIGADTITACEAFLPVANCAKSVIRNNGFEQNIKLIEKRSTELTSGSGGDLEQRANILVTEVFDTELIGEGALSTFSHALKNLLEQDSIVIPSAATVYAQVVSSDNLLRWNKLQTLSLEQELTIIVPCEISQCSGAAAVHDIQMAQISTRDFIPLTKPIPVFEFDFTGKNPLQMEEVSTRDVVAETSGKCDAIFMWWELKMDPENILSCAPPWAHPNPTNMQWRDHWMQAIYYLPTSINLAKNDTFKLYAYHDEYSLWFDAVREKNFGDTISRPICSCGAHALCSRTRLGMLNDPVRNKTYFNALKRIINPESVCLYVGDFSLIPLIAAKLGAKKVFAVQNDNNKITQKVLESYIISNQLNDKLIIIDKKSEDLTAHDLNEYKVNVLLSEPFFSTCILPWDSLHFLYQYAILEPHLIPDVIVMPQKIVIRAVAVEFQHLWKIRAPVHSTHGFNLSAFDNMVQEAIGISDESVEPHALWEYPGKAMTNSFDIITFKENSVKNSAVQEANIDVTFLNKGTCNGIALWTDYHLDEQNIITTGPVSAINPGKEISWDKYCRQGVYFIPNPVSVKDLTHYSINATVTFNPKHGSLNFSFNINNVRQ